MNPRLQRASHRSISVLQLTEGLISTPSVAASVMEEHGSWPIDRSAGALGLFVLPNTVAAMTQLIPAVGFR